MGIYDKKEVIQWLLDEGYLVLVDGRPIITSKLEKEIGYIAPIPITLTPQQISNELTKPTTYSTDPKAVWNKFIEDSSIPHRVITKDGSSYTVRQYGVAVAKRLLKIINDPKIDYQRLVDSTRNYYKTTDYKHLLSNYIVKDIWYHEYESWKPGAQKKDARDGSNPWEE